jgi:hypothetical protein
MIRREFIKKAGIATAGAFAVPYILPSGRLFAASGIRRVNHVVFCMFAGGVRNLESVDKALGNLMPNMLQGLEVIPFDIALALSGNTLPALNLGYNLQSRGTLFKEFRYKSGPTGHFNGHTTAITGAYTTADLNIKDHPHTPTIFEFYRKHNSPAQTARKCWWVSNTLGPYPALNFSSFAGYGAQYGANFIAPTYMFSNQGYNSIGTLKTFTSAEEAAVNNMRTFMNNNFNKSFVDGDAGVTNTEADAVELQSWINSMFSQYQNGSFNNPWNAGSSMNNDMMNIFFAEKIIDQFAPELLVVNMQDVDVAHFNFTDYAVNLHKADYAVAHLWKHIQNSSMANDTVMIIAPEHGRNAAGNSSIDENGRAALDHTAALDEVSGDQMAREIFCMVLGPPGVVQQGQVITATAGESIDIASSVANLLGFDSQMPSGLLRDFNATGIQQAFV